MKFSIKDNKIKVSIITIIYNNLIGIKKTMESVINQNYPNIEFIVIDGGSSDGTVEFIKNNANKITFWISEKDNGISDAFNKGLKYVTGDLVFFLNSGDTFIDSKIVSKAVNVWTEKQVDVLFYKVKVTDKVYIPSELYKNNGDKIWDMSDVPHQGAFIKSSLFKEIGIFNINYHIRMDFEFFARCKINKCTYKFIPQVIVLYELGGKSMIRSNRRRFWEEGMAVKYLYNISLSYKDKIKAVMYR